MNPTTTNTHTPGRRILPSEIINVLVVSTDNVSRETYDRLAGPRTLVRAIDIPGVVAVPQGLGRGCLIRFLDHAHDGEWPDDLAVLARLASALGCDWISIDPDGPNDKNLKQYPWT